MDDTTGEPSADARRVDVVMYPSGEVKAVPAGKGAAIVRSYRERNDVVSFERRVLTWLLVAAVLAYSLLVVRNLLLGVVAGTLVYASARLVPQFAGSDAGLLDDDVRLRDAREQWEAEPVSEAELPDEPERRAAPERREREHAYE